LSASASGTRRGVWRLHWQHIGSAVRPALRPSDPGAPPSRKPPGSESAPLTTRFTLTCSGCEAQGSSLPAAAGTTEISARGAEMVRPRMRPDARAPDILARRWAPLLLALCSFLPVSHAGAPPARGRGVRHATGRRDAGAPAVCRRAGVCGAPIPRPLATLSCAGEGTCCRNAGGACDRSGARDGAQRL
jgi:hypothetical protein